MKTVIAAVVLLVASAAQGQPLKAILVEGHQQPTTLAGIVTAYDLPRLRSLGGR